MARHSESHESRRGFRLPFDASDRKKLYVFGGLAAVCAVIVMVQVWQHKGPATAEAASGVAAGEFDLEAVIEEMRNPEWQRPGGTESQSLFGCVDEAIDLFVGGMAPPASSERPLRANVFGLPAGAAASMEGLSAASKEASLGKDAADPMAADLAKLTLETVLVSTRNRAAIINGQVFHRGEAVGEFTVVEIEPGRVTLARDGVPYVLKLK